MMDKGMKKRWISLYVENQVGVLSKISGLFSGKSYNLDSLTVGTTCHRLWKRQPPSGIRPDRNQK